MPKKNKCLFFSLLFSITLTWADGFHGAMNADELEEIWERNKYELLTQNNPSSRAQIAAMAQMMLRHLKYLNSINVIPREFPNFRESGVPQAKASAMRVLKELGKQGLAQIIEALLHELKYGPSRPLTWAEQIERAQKGENIQDSSMTPNEDYLDNLIKIIYSIGEDAIDALENERTKADPKIRVKLDEILAELKKTKKEFIPRKAVSPQEIENAIRLGIQFLRRTQQSNGTWDYPVFGNRNYSSGVTALVLYALLKSGVSPEDPTLQAGKKAMFQRVDSTYTLSLWSLFLSELDRKTFQEALKANALWLENKQVNSGLWGYSYGNIEDTFGDFSNTQFAVLGLRACEQAGITVSSLTWMRAKNAYLSAQNPDGGFGYRLVTSSLRNSYGSMTASALASLVLLGEDFNVPIARAKLEKAQGAYKPTHEDCGKYVQNKSIERGIEWLSKNFSVDYNPGTSGIYPFHYYYLFCLEQVGTILQINKFGNYDWYNEGAQYLLQNQRQDGSWDQVINTAFALLFLSKKNKIPILHHLQWEKEGTVHQNDMKNLLFFAKGFLAGDPTYRVVTLHMPLEELLQAPILFVNGHRSFSLSPEEREKIRLFLESGGTLYAEACCGQREFDQGFRKEMSFIYPNRTLQPLPAEHPVYQLVFDIASPEHHWFEGYPGCQTRVIYSPIGHSCRWDENYWRYDVAFKLGTNVLLYAMGSAPKKERSLKDLLQIDEEKEKSLRRGALIMAQIKHNGDWSPDPIAIPRLMSHLRETANLRVSLKRKEIALDDPEIYAYPILYLTGHYNFSLSDEEIKQLRNYLDKGGFLFADACCGRVPFDQAFRNVMQKVFPDAPMLPISHLHPIFQLGHPISSVNYKPFMGKDRLETTLPKLEMISLQNRASVIYSPEDLGCALEDHVCVDCHGLTRESALKLASNIILYGLNY